MQPGPKYIAGIRFQTSWISQSGLDNPDAINQDLNEHSGGKYIYPVKQWTWHREEAISQFAFISYLMFEDEVPAGFEKLDQDLNEGAGGATNYLCVKRGSVDSPKVLDINFRSYHSSLKETIVDNWFVFPHDLNTGAKDVGKYVYLLYRTE